MVSDKMRKKMRISTKYQILSERRSIVNSKARIAKLQAALKRLERRWVWPESKTRTRGGGRSAYRPPSVWAGPDRRGRGHTARGRHWSEGLGRPEGRAGCRRRTRFNAGVGPAHTCRARGGYEMAKKKKLRTRKAKVKARRASDSDIKFQLYLDSTYGLNQKELYNISRSYGTSKRKSRSFSRALTRRR